MLEVFDFLCKKKFAAKNANLTMCKWVYTLFLMLILEEHLEFVWDIGNKEKNLLRHHVGNIECEEAFFSRRVIYKNELHSGKEDRYVVLGETKTSRKLFVVFTIREGRVRVISARDLSKKERRLYEERIDSAKI